MSAALLIALTLAPASPTEAPPSDAELLRRAEEAFAEGVRRRSTPQEARKEFAASAYAYDQLRRRGVGGVELRRNLGNAALLADELPAAVLAYRRGLKLAPHDADLRERLEYARSLVTYPDGRGRPPADAWPPWLPRPAPWLVLLVAVLFYAGACVALTRWLMLRRGPGLGRAVALCVVAVTVAGYWAVREWQASQERAAPVAVITAEDVALLQGNGPSYPAARELPRVTRGMEARLLHRRGGWLQLEFPGGLIGWVPQSAALTDEPE